MKLAAYYIARSIELFFGTLWYRWHRHFHVPFDGVMYTMYCGYATEHAVTPHGTGVGSKRRRWRFSYWYLFQCKLRVQCVLTMRLIELSSISLQYSLESDRVVASKVVVWSSLTTKNWQDAYFIFYSGLRLAAGLTWVFPFVQLLHLCCCLPLQAMEQRWWPV